ncbi:iron complex outermembrane receptor protein [Novosphingobium sp. PhB165]|uniref:TonB-dependent receptor plug domain-containing protein n=1 Tax=Novosphingobium sp. PhB165 TaxID=2485105 RepID=UPI0010DD8AAB|nr:TonB-dependent receptor [Novosphingobium sp. PhB165]TCM14198.1 iron complex outermembrane receptor protein [Novosphingobium sp. PhB165]
MNHIVAGRLAGASLLALFMTMPIRAEAQSAAPSDDSGGTANAIIVTGTRQTGLKAADSAAPIQVLDADTLARVGQPSLSQALTQIVPSFTAQAFGGDAANLTLTARLRGLSPNHTLILVNGKRRHPSANLQVSAGPYQGGAAPDLDLIPPAAIERIEVLQDGAAAQYGSDAIAGVINIILKSDSEGGQASATAGQYYHGDGETFGASGRIALPIGERGYFDLTLFHRFHDFSQRGGGDKRISNSDGTLLAGLPASWASIPGFPRLNGIYGDARSRLTTGVYNAGYDLGGAELYSFGSYGRRTARAVEQYRLPNRVSRTVDGVTTLPFPDGFTPFMGLEEDDYSFTGGIRNNAGAWRWDLSGTYGRNKVRISTLNSANASLYADTGFTPRDFYDGAFTATQFTGNLDISREIDVGFDKPLNLAFGGEYRRDTYAIEAGDDASTYKEGGQSFPGFQSTDAGHNSRQSGAGYVDISANPVDAWTVDVAGRFEHYSDFGSTAIGKLTTRYDISPAFALRGTASTGFRAPTLGESFYSATQVSPTTAVVQLPANSAAAALLGFQPLKAEKSTNFSAGLVATPTSSLTITLDAYQIRIRNRITSTGNLLGKSGTTIIDQNVLDAIAAHGNVIDPGSTYVAASTFANAIDTRTRGVDLSLATSTRFDASRIDWTLDANYNRTKVTRDRLPAGVFTPQARGDIETASPKFKIGLGALFTSGALSVNLRETIYGPASSYASADLTTYYPTHIDTAAITDLELGYELARGVQFAIGANNLFNKRPPDPPFVPGTTTYVNSSLVWGGPLTYAAYGFNGGYYYGRITVNF